VDESYKIKRSNLLCPTLNGDCRLQLIGYVKERPPVIAAFCLSEALTVEFCLYDAVFSPTLKNDSSSFNSSVSSFIA
jgi:hypothetical protein